MRLECPTLSIEIRPEALPIRFRDGGADSVYEYFREQASLALNWRRKPTKAELSALLRAAMGGEM